MKYRVALYVGLAVVGAASFFASLLLPIEATAKTLAALPFVGALFAGLFQILRDHSSFQHDAIIQQREHAFVVAATSHMSRVVFDKHVAFAEEYVEALMKILGTLFEKGPKVDLNIVDPLHEVRRKYRLWVSAQLASSLDHFESKLLDMVTAKQMSNDPDVKHLERQIAYSLFKEILNLKGEQGTEATKKRERGYALVIEELQKVLGVEQLTSLRDHVLGATQKKQS